MTSRAANTEAKHLLLDLIEVLQDGHKGMLDLGQRLQRPAHREFILRESQVRAEFSGAIENELHRLGEHDVEQKGTVGGAIHRAWGDLKAHLGASDDSLLGAAELGELGTRMIYEKVLAGSLPGDVHDLVLTQHRHIVESLNQLRAMRGKEAA